jgi:hypothetical protein
MFIINYGNQIRKLMWRHYERRIEREEKKNLAYHNRDKKCNKHSFNDFKTLTKFANQKKNISKT